MFDYDTQLPLDYQEHDRQDRNGVIVSDVSYASPCGGRVSALLLVPPGTGPFAGLLFMHPGGADRYAFLEEASLVAQGGAVALLIDAPYARPPVRPIFNFTEQDLHDFVQVVIDLRRGLDVLLARPDVAVDRLGYVGFSYGATIGALLAAAEPRLKACILWGGAAHLTDFLRGQARKMAEPQLNAYLDMMKVVDSINHIGQAAPAALFFQNGRQDVNVPEADAKRLHEVASEPKQVVWYDAGHALDGKACQDRYAWLREQLNLAPLPPALIKQLGKFKLKQMMRPR